MSTIPTPIPIPETTSGTSGRHGIYGLLEEFRSRPRPENPSELRLWIEKNADMLVAEAQRAEAAGEDEGDVTAFELTPEVLAKVYRGPLPLNEFMDLLVETDSPYTVEIRAAQAAKAARLEKARAAHQASVASASSGAALTPELEKSA